MYLLTPEDLLERFTEGQTVAVVGNSGSLNGEALGKWIDEHDIVVRFNECPIEGYEQDVGKKTNILITNPYPKNRTPLTHSPDLMVINITPLTRRAPSDEFKQWLGNSPVLFTYTPDLVQVGNIEHTAGLTTGTYGLNLASRLLKPSKISITGFTLFQELNQAHYWSASLPKGAKSHDMCVEAPIFIRLCNSMRCETVVTQEILWLSKKIGTQLSNKIYIKNLKNMAWQTRSDVAV